MKFPAINKQSKRRISIPELTGGLNLREGPTHCNDNQLTELVNMWYTDGALRTRPGVEEKELLNIYNVEVSDSGIRNKYTFFKKIQAHNIYRDTEDGRSQLCSVWFDYSISGTQIYFFWCGGSEAEALPTLRPNGLINSFFVTKRGSTTYCFTSNHEIYSLSDSGDSWVLVEEKDYYIPLVATYCKPVGVAMTSDEALASGVSVEGYNLLCDYYKIEYNAYNEDIAYDDTVGIKKMHGHTMYYSLLKNPKGEMYKGKTVTVTLLQNDKEYKHQVTLDGTGDEVAESEYGGIGTDRDTLKMHLRGTMLWFTYYESNNYEPDTDFFIEAYGNTENNLTIIAPYIANAEEKSKIFLMTKTEWFGGASAGLAGGTRLFLCGYSGDTDTPEDKALVVWSGLNNPLYFPENSYFYVGNTAEKVTGFGKQSDKLIIFKESETWYTQYYQNTEITASDLINQSVVDIQASMVYFPLTQINPYIGCPYPDTIQLCRNRLVWLGNGGNVYTLVSDNQYNERSIFTVSDMVKPKLSKETLTDSAACDWNGYYCLSLGDKVYLMDYNSYGYVYVASYSKTEDASLRIPWYYWELPQSTGEKLMHVAGNRLCFMSYCETGAIYNDLVIGYTLDLDSKKLTDGSKPIKSIMQTKFFDFGEPNFFKNISSVGLSLGYNGGEEITATFVTDGGEEQTGVFLEDEAEERAADFTKSVILSPGIYSSVRFGIRLECEGSVIVDGLTIDYRTLGKAR